MTTPRRSFSGFCRALHLSMMERIMRTLNFNRPKKHKANSPAACAINNQMRGLPVELWIIILELAVESDIASYDKSHPFNLPLCIREWDYLTIKRNARWKDLRLVCRNWSILLNPRWTPFIKVDRYPDLLAGVRVRGVYISDTAAWTDVTLKPHPFVNDFHLVARNITTIVIGAEEPIIKASQKSIDFLFGYSEYFSNVRSLSLFVLVAPVAQFWKDLEAGFPLLTSLRVRSYGIGRYNTPSSPGNIMSDTKFTLLHLETVEISLFVLPICEFPALKHAALCVPLNDTISSVFNNKTQNIESLLIWDHGVFTRGPLRKFWKTFPNLRFLGVQEVTIHKLRSPPKDHPLEHICLLNLSMPKQLPDIRKIRVRFAHLRYLTTDLDNKQADASTIVLFREACEKVGLVYVEVVNRKRPKPLAPAPALASAPVPAPVPPPLPPPRRRTITWPKWLFLPKWR